MCAASSTLLRIENSSTPESSLPNTPDLAHRTLQSQANKYNKEPTHTAKFVVEQLDTTREVPPSKSVTISINVESNPPPASSLSPKGKKAVPKKKAKRLPHWCKSVSWVLLIFWSFAMSFLMITYGLKFDLEGTSDDSGVSTSARWLYASGSSIGLDVFVTEPIVLIVNAVVVVFLGECIGEAVVETCFGVCG